MLPLDKSLRLVKLLLPHVPDDAIELTILEFGGKILDSVIQKGMHRDYLRAVEILTDKPIDDLIKLDILEVFELFVNGLIENEFLSLLEFERGLRMQHG